MSVVTVWLTKDWVWHRHRRGVQPTSYGIRPEFQTQLYPLPPVNCVSSGEGINLSESVFAPICCVGIRVHLAHRAAVRIKCDNEHDASISEPNT